MSARPRMLLLATVAVLAAGCGQTPDAPPMRLTAENQLPPGAETVTSALDQLGSGCGDPIASLRPGAQPSPGSMPAGSAMAKIVQNGKLRVGVDQNSFMFGYRNPASGRIEGFDIDIAREIARDIFGDPDRIELTPIVSARRVPALQNAEVDIVVQTLSPTCERRKAIEFSTSYFESDQRLLVANNSGINSTTDLVGKRVCGVKGTTTLGAILAVPQKPTVIAMNNWLDCLTALQQAQVDAASTDIPILHGLQEQDPNLRIVGEPLATDTYAVGIGQNAKDLVRFVNGVLERVRGDGTWQRLYANRLSALGPAPTPPSAKYLG
ncbi:glutamate ABC transporter substrate-binding protein [Nocardia sp. NBC_01503]|uniref:glutamate ABC transporter substrate-binding protein n=1 Tax=Nocardia sp. NBC_01503 TaxID=2975997 RepID=UPI002E7B4064|nr:glutamate ABC transporter substrate-binding protein [Nocardia sp. NBC_01503]WTL32022.1 glutamate ABC transporter substrate-binding protein [Nocardia sp. NBC_01503]